MEDYKLDKTLKEASNNLIESLKGVLDCYENINLGKEITPIDAFFSYRLLLGRNPDPSIELPGILSISGTFREFLNTLLASEEFSKTVNFMPPNKLLMGELDGFRFWFNTADREMGAAMAFGLYEPGSVELMKKVVKPGMRCLDIGAQTGFYTCLMASLVGETGSVFAFEPVPSSFSMVEKNIKENRFEKRVKAYQLAASNKSTTINAIKVSGMYVVGQVDNAESVSIKSVRVDEVVEGPIDIIKIDVEGHELAALEGMWGLITRYKPVIISEANEYWLRTCSNSSANELVKLLASFGYEIYDADNLQQRIMSDSLSLDLLDKIDIVAIPESRSSLVLGI
jgi:FkbM family methyltransferase